MGAAEKVQERVMVDKRMVKMTEKEGWWRTDAVGRSAREDAAKRSYHLSRRKERADAFLLDVS